MAGRSRLSLAIWCALPDVALQAAKPQFRAIRIIPLDCVPNDTDLQLQSA